ncbi:MAG: endonuclease MutS2 [candidate division KSB1 bacterium]|nr:endonuclease MutS2 [candidate division KSB1 bacterium]
MTGWERSLEALEFPRIVERLCSHALSEPAREELARTAPLRDGQQIRREQALVSEMRRILEFDDPFPLSPFPDIRPHLRKAGIEDSVLSPQELVEVSTVAVAASAVQRYFRGKSDKYPELAQLVSGVSGFAWLHKEISYAIDLHTYEVLDRASPELARLRKQILSTEEAARRRVEAILRELAQKGYLQDDVITIRDGRLVLMVKEEFRSKVPGLVHDHSASGQSYFIEPVEAFELNNRVRELRVEERKEVERILRRLTAMLRAELPALSENFRVLVEVDRIHAKARFSQEIGASEPIFNDYGRYRIVEGRHPLLLLRWKDPTRVVPLSLDLGENFVTLVITGPNAGGKTVALKTVGLIVVMAHAGLHVPAAPDTEVAFTDEVFAEIGDLQSVEMDLSTFSSRIQRLKEIVEGATGRSLVLVDEIGSGTDPEEGAALAMSVLEELTARGARTIVTTHLGVLKAFAHRHPGMENGSMEFDPETLSPTYRFRIGIPGSSYAFEIARRLGLPEGLVRRARERVGQEKHRLESLIAELDRRLQELSDRTHRLAQREAELQQLKEQYEESLRTLKEQQREIRKKALEEAEELLRNTNALIERTVREIREQQAAREVVREARRRLEEQKEAVAKQLASLRAESREPTVRADVELELRPGSRVIWSKFGTEALVLDEPDSEGRVLVEAGSVKVRVPLEELAPASRPSRGTGGGTSYRVDSLSEVRPEVDLRGLSVADALAEVDRFLDMAVLAGLSTVRIVHGKGTGRLRTEIQRFLRDDPRVRSARTGQWNEGDLGVTVVELKG